ncbi:MAG: NAD(P)H-hydrate dehydratase [Chitinophagaceae bacterium]|nr:NAD(P)H-hydrate dehydratase [Chitinophagaceae bacterium]
MQIFNTTQIRAWDEYTIQHEPISSVDLMERAAEACCSWIMNNGFGGKEYSIFCAKGNNGGDGLAIARILSEEDYKVSVYILEFGNKGTDDFQVNLARLHETSASIKFISSEEHIPQIDNNQLIIDALLGSGLNRTPEGLTAAIITSINASDNKVIAIDIPSGLFIDRATESDIIIKADHTLSFQSNKLAFMMQESQEFTGRIHILDIRLHKNYLQLTPSDNNIITEEIISGFIRPRKKYSHKGDYGYGGLIAGSKGMMGAAVLSAKAFMRSGGGKLSCHIPSSGYEIMQISVPEAMSKQEEGDEYILSVSSLDKYDTLGIGPGLGQHQSHKELLLRIFNTYRKPVVIDADALNIISENKELLDKVPAHSVLTPHPKEFERLFGKAQNDFQRMELALQNAAKYNIIIVVKGPDTFIATPDGKGYFNSTGNPGMATAGAGDVLTGVITGLLAQELSPEQATIAGVYLHGSAGDIAALQKSEQSMIASDIIDNLGNAFLQVM